MQLATSEVFGAMLVFLGSNPYYCCGQSVHSRIMRRSLDTHQHEIVSRDDPYPL